MRLARRLWAPHAVQVHRRPVRAVNFDGLGERLCTASEDGTAKVFEVNSGKLLKERKKMRCYTIYYIRYTIYCTLLYYYIILLYY